MSYSLEKWILIFLKVLVILLAGVGVYAFFVYFWPLFVDSLAAGLKAILPFLIAYLIGTILNPIITYLQKRFRFSRSWGTLIVLIIFLSVIGGLLYLLAANLIRELIQISRMLGALSQNLDPELWNLDVLTERIRLFLVNLHLPAPTIRDALNSFQGVFDVLRNFSEVLLRQLLYLVKLLPQYLIILVIMIIAVFFFARDNSVVRTTALQLVPVKWQASAKRVASSLNKAFFGYLKAILILVSISGLLSLFGLMILGVKYAFVLAIIVAFIDILPVLGPGTLYVPWAVWLLSTGDLRLGIGLLILYGIIVIVRQLLEPKIVGDNIGLHPLTTLISLYFGFTLLGLWGLVLGPAAVIAYKAFREEKAGN